MRVLLPLKTFWPMNLTTLREFPWREDEPPPARIPPSTTRCVHPSLGASDSNATAPCRSTHLRGLCARTYIPPTRRRGSLGSTPPSLNKVRCPSLDPSTYELESGYDRCQPPHFSAAIALGAESVEVSQQMDAAPAPADSRAPKDDVELIVLDAVMSFVGHQDYLTAAPQLHHLLNVRAFVQKRAAVPLAPRLFSHLHRVCSLRIFTRRAPGSR